MKETNEMSLFVFSYSALNRVNTVMQMKAKVDGTKKDKQKKETENMVVGGEFPPHTGVCPPSQQTNRWQLLAGN